MSHHKLLTKRHFVIISNEWEGARKRIVKNHVRLAFIYLLLVYLILKGGVWTFDCYYLSALSCSSSYIYNYFIHAIIFHLPSYRYLFTSKFNMFSVIGYFPGHVIRTL